MKNKDIFYIGIYPNGAILDQWLPIVNLIKRKRRGAFCVAIIDVGLIEKISNEHDFLSVAAANLFDGVLVRTETNNLFYFESFKFVFAVRQSMYWFIRRAWKKIAKRPRKKMLLPKVVGHAFDGFYRKNKITYFDNPLDGGCLLTDTSFIENFNGIEVIHDLRISKVFCLPHGTGCSSLKRKENPLPRGGFGLILFVHSESDREAVTKKFMLNSDECVVSGVPKHDKTWMQYIAEQGDLSGLPERYVYVTTQSARFDFPKEQKKRILQSIKTLCKEVNSDLVVRPHPKENVEELKYLLDEVFRDSDEVNWFIEFSSALAAAKNAFLAVHMSLSMVQDTVFLGVPSVVYREKGSRCKFGWGLYDQEGNKISPPEHHGYASSAVDRDSFFQAARSLQENGALSGLEQRKKLFRSEGLQESAAEFISDYILKDC